MIINVKKIIYELGYTTQQVAEICGVTRRTVQRWMIGNHMPYYAMKLILNNKENKNGKTH